MKKQKKTVKVLPEVKIFGDIKAIKNLIKFVNKKKSVVVFRDKEQGQHYAEIEDKLQLIPLDLISNLEKEYRFIYFDFFPTHEKAESAPEPLPEAVHSVKTKPRGRPARKKAPVKRPEKVTKTEQT